MAKENIEVDLKHILRDLDGLSPKTSTYQKLKQKEKEIRTKLRELDKSYAKVCKRDGCVSFCVMLKFFDGTRRYYDFCAKHRQENLDALNKKCNQ